MRILSGGINGCAADGRGIPYSPWRARWAAEPSNGRDEDLARDKRLLRRTEIPGHEPSARIPPRHGRIISVIARRRTP